MTATFLPNLSAHPFQVSCDEVSSHWTSLPSSSLPLPLVNQNLEVIDKRLKDLCHRSADQHGYFCLWHLHELKGFQGSVPFKRWVGAHYSLWLDPVLFQEML